MLDRRKFNVVLISALFREFFVCNNAKGEAVIPTVTGSNINFEELGETGPIGTGVNAIAWSPDGNLLALTTRGGSHIQLWDVIAKRKVWEQNKRIPDGSTSLEFHKGGQLIISSAADNDPNAALSLLDAETGKIIHNIDKPAVFEHRTFATSWRLNAEGTRLAARFYTAKPMPLAVYETDNWRIKSIIDSVSTPHRRNFAFDPLSGFLATNTPPILLGKPNPRGEIKFARQALIELWDVDSNQLKAQFPMVHGWLSDYMPGSSHMLLVSIRSTSENSVSGEINVFDPGREVVLRSLAYEGQIRHLAVSRDGACIAAAFWGWPLVLWRLSPNHPDTSPQTVEVTRADVAGPAFSPAANTMVFGLGNKVYMGTI